jgi:hypothetical protein
MVEKIVIYLIGSLRNEKIPHIAKEIRSWSDKFEVFDDWFSPGPEADDFWRKYEKVRGSTYKQALKNYAGKHIYEFDNFHINRSHVAVLTLPAGKSGHMEFGKMRGQGKPGFVLFDKEPERWDVMYQIATEVCISMEELKAELMKLEVPRYKPIDYEAIASSINYHNQCAKLTLGELPLVTAEDIRRTLESTTLSVDKVIKHFSEEK